jgi:hypothetical protein
VTMQGALGLHIATATKAIIARFLRVVTLYSMANSSYYLYLAGRLIFLPRVLTLGRGAGEACEDAATAAAPLLACFDLGLLGGPCEALRLLVWVFVDGFLVFGLRFEQRTQPTCQSYLFLALPSAPLALHVAPPSLAL